MKLVFFLALEMYEEKIGVFGKMQCSDELFLQLLHHKSAQSNFGGLFRGGHFNWNLLIITGIRFIQH